MKTAEQLLIEIDRLHGDDTVHATKEEILEIMEEYKNQIPYTIPDKPLAEITDPKRYIQTEDYLDMNPVIKENHILKECLKFIEDEANYGYDLVMLCK